jgi:K+-transporting ATPase ATPase A chain
VVQTFKPYANGRRRAADRVRRAADRQGRQAVLDEKGQAKTKKSTLKEQVIAVGPAPRSQVAIKQLGTNGGGFFNVNSAHPLENATPLANFLEMLSILVISAALCYTFGVMVGDTRQGWASSRR